MEVRSWGKWRNIICNCSEATLLSSFCLSQIKTAAFTWVCTRKPVVIQTSSLCFQQAWSGAYDPISFLRFCSDFTNYSPDPLKSKSSYFTPQHLQFKQRKHHSATGPGSPPRKDAQPMSGDFYPPFRVLSILLRANLSGSPCVARSYSLLSYVKSGQCEVK